MKRTIGSLCLFAVSACIMMMPAMHVNAEDTRTFSEGIYADDIDLSGMTVDEAEKKIQERVDERKNSTITLNIVDGKQVSVKASDLGLTWGNEADLSAAAEIGKTGNIIKRYKENAELKKNKKVCTIKYDFDGDKIADVISKQCEIGRASCRERV